MIGWLSGRVVDKSHPGKIVLDVNGVGYDLETSLSSFFQIESIAGIVSVYVHTVVREDAFLLYGFIDKDERALFRALIKVNGIGPKVAMAILSKMSPHEFVQCIYHQDARVLTKLPGIGQKTAERLLVEMKDSVAQWSISENQPAAPIEPPMSAQKEAISALVVLGYKPQEAHAVIRKVDDGHQSCEQLIRLGLQALSVRQGG